MPSETWRILRMPPIDPRSIVLVGFLLGVFCSVVLFQVRRTFRDTIPGLSAWAWGCLMAAIAAALFVVHPHRPYTFSILPANSLLTAGLVLMYAGLRQFTGQSANYRLLAGAWLALVCLAAGLIHVHRYPAFPSLFALFNGTVFLASGLAALKIRKAGPIEWLTGGAFLLTAFVCYARSLTAAYGFHSPSGLYDPSLLQTIYIASYPLVALTTSIGFMLMVEQRVRAIVVGMNANLESAVEKRTAELRAEIARRERLEHEVAQIVDKARRRIGQELHDNLGQRMAGLSLLAEALAARLKAIAPELSDQANAIERTASEAVLETRRLAHGLMPVVPGAKDLRAALAELAENVSLDGRLHCSFCSDAPIEVKDEYAATHLFRIAQESVSNLIRHGHSTEAAIRLGRVDDKTTLSITDNGVGFSSREGEQAGGHGLRIMAYRAALIGYDLNIESVPGSGTTIKVSECRTPAPAPK
ncbi:MAG: histidine kinase [Burkholderiales bacterium]